MFDAFSSRSRIVVFVARFKAGERGSTTIDTEDLLIGLIREDQGTHGPMLSSFPSGEGSSVFPAPTHKQFFDPTIATTLQGSIEKSLPNLEPIATLTEIPLSDGLTPVFDAADAYRTQFQHDEVEPLHLLAAVFNDEGSVAERELLKIGVTRDEVLKGLRTD
jgi:hypothetical protein